MLGKNLIRKSITLFAAVAVWSAFSMIAIAAPTDMMGEISVTGQVTVNGQSVVSNSTVSSGSSITTAANASAIVSLGKNGRIEIPADSTVTLKFSDNSIVAMLTSGKVRISNAAGIGATVTTRNATVIGDAAQANTFGVDVGCSDEERCTQTFVETTVGAVTVRNGSNDRQVAAGTDATFGNPSQTGCKPCLRPGSSAPLKVAGLGAGALAALLLAAGGAAIAAIILGNQGNDVNPGPGPIVISPSR